MRNELIILKLGGSLITDKSKPYSIRKEIIDQSINEIIQSEKKLVVVHGGGSYGHPLAKEYRISNGLDSTIENQIFGLARTHEAMIRLNLMILESFLRKNHPVITIQPFSAFIKDSDKTETKNVEIIKTSLEIGITPILYGDVVIDREQSFSILSGDLIILELCKRLHNFPILKVIFAIEKDGVFIDKDGKTELLKEIKYNKIDTLHLANLENKIDVTGSIKGKLDIIKQIGELMIPVQIVNGLHENNIYKALINQDVKSTSFHL